MKKVVLALGLVGMLLMSGCGGGGGGNSTPPPSPLPPLEQNNNPNPPFNSMDALGIFHHISQELCLSEDYYNNWVNALEAGGGGKDLLIKAFINNINCFDFGIAGIVNICIEFETPTTDPEYQENSSCVVGYNFLDSALSPEDIIYEVDSNINILK